MKKMASTAIAAMFIFIFAFSAQAFLGSNVSKAKEFMQAGIYPQAIALLEKEIFGYGEDKGNPTNAEAHFQLGICYVYEGRHSSADKRFASAVKLKADYGYQIGRVYQSVGNEALAKGQLQKANKLFEKAVRYDLRLKSKIANKLFEIGKSSGNESYFSLAVRFNQGIRERISDYYNSRSETAKDKEAQVDLKMKAAEYNPDKYGQEAKEDAFALGQSYLEEAKKYARIPGKEGLTDKYKRLARRYLGDAVEEKELPDYRIYGPGTYTFSLKAGEQTDHWIGFAKKGRYILGSKDDKFKLLYDDGDIVPAWTLGDWPDKQNIKFKIIAVTDQPEIKMTVK